MAIQRPIIKQQILSLINSVKEQSAEQGEDFFAEQLTNIISDAISSITITIPPGAIITVGSPSTQSNSNPVVISGTVT